MKRKSDEPHLSKEEYDAEASRFGAPSAVYGSFSRAAPGALAKRSILHAAHPAKKRSEFSRYAKALNSTFYNWFKEQVAKDATIDLTDAAREYVYYCKELENRYLCEVGEVLTFGSGDCGQLAHGIEEDSDLMVRYPRIVYSLRDKKVCGIACGGLHNAVYTDQGKVYTWGCADDGSLGRDGEENFPHIVDALQDEVIVAVACGDGQTLAVSTKGECWGWGSFKDKEGKKWFNIKDSSNLKAMKDQQNRPIVIPGLPNDRVVEVACGAAFNIARCSDGSVYSWGLGECGELGREVPPMKKGSGEEAAYDLDAIYRHHITPSHMYKKHGNMEKVTDVKSIGCGAYHSLLILMDGSLWVCGLNNYSQLGLGDTEPRSVLHEVTALSHEILAMAKGGVHHTLVLTSEGKLLAFGRGDSGQLGAPGASEGSAGGFSSSPLEPALPAGTKATSIACGGNHNLVVTSEGDVYSWGYGDMLALGHGLEQDEPLPKKLNFSKARIDKIKVTQIAGGGQHSAIIGIINR